ncbi:hypothetical protein PG997_015006 [Apiospora hydei]|uniref:Uncharacterized protein n=1 Tax=Apiospora hydei TaxID=1337664 RepID=A0ABR1UVE8_9PEZI
MGNGNQRQMNDPPVDVMAHIQAGASSEDDARYRNLALAYLAFEPSQEVVGAAPPSSAVTNTPAHVPNSTGYIGPTHVGSMSTPPAAQGSAPAQLSVPSVGSRGPFASQPVLSTVEVQQTPRPFSFSQGDTSTNQKPRLLQSNEAIRQYHDTGACELGQQHRLYRGHAYP